MANIEREVLIDAPDQPIAACGFIFPYAAKRKTPARNTRPMISRFCPSDPRVFVVIEVSLLAQQRVEKLLQNRISHESRRRRILLSLIENYERRRSLHRHR